MGFFFVGLTACFNVWFLVSHIPGVHARDRSNIRNPNYWDPKVWGYLKIGVLQEVCCWPHSVPNASAYITLVKDWTFGPREVFGLWGRKVYFKVLLTIWSKDKVISSLKTAQNLNFKVRNPIKLINFTSKWTPIYTLF